jgi:hypothetical protein
MSVNGKPNEGDVYLDEDGYMVTFLKNSNGCWYRLYLAPEHKGDTIWLSDATSDVYARGKYVMNILKLLVAVRKDVLDESSN